MNQTIKALTALVFATALFFTACKKDANKKTCSSTLHGYTAPPATSSFVPSTCNHGIISSTTSAIATSGSFSGSIFFSNKAAYNTSDNCYYVFGYTGSYPVYTRYLYKIDAVGTTTAYAVPDTTNAYSSLVYNNVTNKLYCTKNGTALAEITFGGTSFTTTTVVTPTYPFSYFMYVGEITNLAVDHSSGDMYFGTMGSPHHIEKYHPGATATSVVATLSDNWPIMELRYNPNDNMLYAIKPNPDTVTYSFIKVSPATGTLTTLCSLGSNVNPDFFSATLDPCTDRYIFSTPFNFSGSVSSIVYQLNMSGTIVQTDTVSAIYQGLDVAY